MSESVVIITGANQGLGHEIVKKLAAENENYRIILCSRSLEKGHQAASEVTNIANNTKVDVVQLDISSDESIESAARTVEDKYGRVDVLVNNAGISRGDAKTVREQMHQGIYQTLFWRTLLTKAISVRHECSWCRGGDGRIRGSVAEIKSPQNNHHVL